MFSVMVGKKPIKDIFQVEFALVRGRVVSDGLDHCHLVHFAGRDKLRQPNMQAYWADRVHGIFKRG